MRRAAFQVDSRHRFGQSGSNRLTIWRGICLLPVEGKSAMPSTSQQAESKLVNRLVALRALLRLGNIGKEEIKRRLPDWYTPDATDKTNDRQIQRDLRALRALGDKVTLDRSAGHYRFQSPSHLELDDSEIETLALLQQTFESLGSTGQEGQRLLNKIVEALPQTQQAQFFRIPPLVMNLRPAADYRPHTDTLHLLNKLIIEKRQVRFRYQPLGEKSLVLHRRIEPYDIEYLNQHFYLLGYSPEAGKVLEFRIDRIREAEPLPTRRGERKRARQTIRFKYRLGARIAQRGISERFLNPRVSHYENGDAIVDAEGYSDFRIIQDLLHYGEQAELLEPSELRAKMGEVVRKMWRLYENDK